MPPCDCSQQPDRRRKGNGGIVCFDHEFQEVGRTAEILNLIDEQTVIDFSRVFLNLS